MRSPAPRRIRADAARNVERIIRAAREVFAERGASAQLRDIAARAGVGDATLYRHFASKEDLIHAIGRQLFDQDVKPAIDQALSNPDPWQAMVAIMEIYLEVASNERGTFAAARTPTLFLAFAAQYFESFAVVLRRAQHAGVVRADLCPDDLPRLAAMLVGAQRLGSDPKDILADPQHRDRTPDEGWRRYLALLLDALRPTAATALPPLR